MKLIGNLKKQVEETKNKEEAKEVIEKAGIELTDEELEVIAGSNQQVYVDPDSECSNSPFGKHYWSLQDDHTRICDFCGCHSRCS